MSRGGAWFGWRQSLLTHRPPHVASGVGGQPAVRGPGAGRGARAQERTKGERADRRYETCCVTVIDVMRLELRVFFCCLVSVAWSLIAHFIPQPHSFALCMCYLAPLPYTRMHAQVYTHTRTQSHAHTHSCTHPRMQPSSGESDLRRLPRRRAHSDVRPSE